ncbi:E3 ubiquitin-protein ligase HOS1-like [Trifolium medium]|uniref:E3 ubiquitin-protein ligase HOS1-like n=1 Tax=Trifolium medium TaxID=97028 RepID=A0A392MEJ1_9FABA|nr:E3 ubiquitin-protein ligase HOS1-like [Trifolium medium]
MAFDVLFQETLEHLAAIDLIELCKEAKVERCRATRDLRSCGRYVHHVLNSCGHASLCEECSQRCDICPICRIPIPKSGTKLRHRLYYECMEAGLISKRNFTDITDVCMDETAVSSDPVIAFLLDEVGISNVLDILESSFKGTLSAQLHDLHHLQESILKTKQIVCCKII